MHTQDMDISYLPYLKDSYNSPRGAHIDKFLKKAIKLFNEKGYTTMWCCSGHTDNKMPSRIQMTQLMKRIGLPIDEKLFKGPECYVAFDKVYPEIKESYVSWGVSVIRLYSCGTLMGIKKTCRKMYRIAQGLEAIK